MRAYMTGFLSWKELLMRINFSGYIVLWLTHIVCFLDLPVNLCTEEKVWRWQGGCGSCTLHEEKGIPWAHESQAALKEGIGASGEKVVAETCFATSSSCCLISCIPSAAVGLKNWTHWAGSPPEPSPARSLCVFQQKEWIGLNSSSLGQQGQLCLRS